MAAREQRRAEQLLEDVARLEQELMKAEGARDALMRQALPLAQLAPTVNSARQRRIFALVATLVLVSVAIFLVLGQMRDAKRTPRGGRVTTPAQPAAKKTGPRAPRERRVFRPGRHATIPLAGLAVVGRAALAADGARVAVAGWQGKVLLVDLRDDAVRWRVEAHTGAARDVVFASETMVISGGADGALKRWRASDGRPSGTLRPAGGSGVRDMDRAGTLLAVGVEGPYVELYRLSKTGGKLLRKIGGHSGWVRAVALSSDEERVATGDHSGKVRLFSVEQGKLLRELDTGRQWTNALAFSPDGRYLAAASFDKRTRVFELDTGKRVHSFRGHSRRALSVSFSPDGGQLATASHDRTAVIWDLAQGVLERRLGQHRYSVSSVAFAPAGRFLLTASTDGALRIWPRELPVADNMRALGKVGPGELVVRSNTTGERSRIRVVDSKGKALAEGRRRLAYILRSGPDDRQGLPHPKLVEVLYEIVDHFGRKREVLMISGFRSDEFNKLRTKQSRQVAKKSRHRKGEAIDFRISGVGITTLRKYVKKLRVGGLGYYPDSQFIHLDVGPVRNWGGN